MARSNDKAERLAAIDAKLKAMFRNVEQRPVPLALREVVDQLDKPVAAPRKRRARKA